LRGFEDLFNILGWVVFAICLSCLATMECRIQARTRTQSLSNGLVAMKDSCSLE
jgi:hypothetical protein